MLFCEAGNRWDAVHAAFLFIYHFLRLLLVEILWWVKACRWLRPTMLYGWGTLIGGIVISVVANMSTTTTDTPLAKLYIIHLILTFPIPFFSTITAFLLLTLLTVLSSRGKGTPLTRIPSQQNRTHLLRRLHLRYEQLHTQSLQGAVQMELGLVSKSAAVYNAANLSFRFPVQQEQPLTLHFSIVDAYRLAQQELLVLGEPGAGKSTLLLELASYLVEMAEQNVAQPLPILLPLSSWVVKDPPLPLQDWLCEQCELLYNVPRSLSEQWVQTEQLLFLLDGLDEMEASARPACIAAINTYHSEHIQPLVVCSRTDEYDTSSVYKRLALHTAFVVQPLSAQRIDAYLEAIGQPLAALRVALKENTVLAELATTPLMLQILILAYHGVSVPELSHKAAQLQKQVWDDYVQRMVNRKGDVKRFPYSVTITQLGHLAKQMRENHQTILFPKQLPSDWLPKKEKIFYRWSLLLVGVLLTILFGTLLSMLLGTPSGVLLGTPAGVLIGTLSIGLFLPSIGRMSYGMGIVTIIALSVGLIIRLSFGLSGTSLQPHFFWTRWGRERTLLSKI